MKRHQKPWMAHAIVVAVALGVPQAARSDLMITYSTTVDALTAQSPVTVSLQQFDPTTQGTLLGITISLEATIAAQATFINTTGQEQISEIIINSSQNLDQIAGTTDTVITTETGHASHPFTPGDTRIVSSNADNSSSIGINTPSEFSPFTGAGTFSTQLT
jgi:hypothetical protein